MNIVRELCARKGIRQKELAKMLGISQPSVSAWFTNKADPSGENLERLTEIFQVSRSVILGYDPIQPQNTGFRSQKDLEEMRKLIDQLTAEELVIIVEMMRQKIRAREGGEGHGKT